MSCLSFPKNKWEWRWKATCPENRPFDAASARISAEPRCFTQSRSISDSFPHVSVFLGPSRFRLNRVCNRTSCYGTNEKGSCIEAANGGSINKLDPTVSRVHAGSEVMKKNGASSKRPRGPSCRGGNMKHIKPSDINGCVELKASDAIRR